MFDKRMVFVYGGAMSTTTRTRSRGTRVALSREVVVEAARDCLRAGGPTALTMRSVATRLETGPASLYAHVADLRELHVLVLDSIAADVELSPDDDAVTVLRRYAQALWAHPGAARLALATPPTGPAHLDLLEAVLTRLLAAGYERDRAAAAVDVLVLLTTAAVAEQEVVRSADDGPDIPEAYQRAIGAEPDRWPHIAAALPSLVEADGTERLISSLRTFLAGLAVEQGLPVTTG